MQLLNSISTVLVCLKNVLGRYILYVPESALKSNIG